MATDSKRQFNRRAFVSLIAAISGLGLPITGLMNHLYGFESLTVRRHFWMSAHNSLAIIFTISAIWHVILNRQALVHHIRAASKAIPGISREFIWALGVVSLIFAIVVGHAFHAG